MTGYLRGVEKLVVTSDYGVSEKLIITIDANITYQIQVGLSTWFAKTFLLSVNSLDDSQLRSLLTIEPSSNSNSKVVFCNIFDWKANKIFPKQEWKRDNKGKLIDDVEWDSLVAKIAARLPLTVNNRSDFPENIEESFTDLETGEVFYEPEKVEF